MTAEVASESDKRWAEENCLEGNETKEDPKHFFFIGNVSVSKTGSKGKKKALIVVGKYRFFQCNKGKIKKRTLTRALHLYDLLEIVGGREAVTFVWHKAAGLTSKEGTLSLDFRAQCLPYLVQAVRTSLMRIAPTFSSIAAYKLLIHENDLMAIEKAVPIGPAGGILDTYKAFADHEKAQASTDFEKYILGLTQRDPPCYDLNLNEIPGIEPKSDISLAIGPLMMALRHNAYFTSIRLDGIAHKGMPALLAELIRHNTTVLRLELIHIDLNAQHFEPVAQALLENPDSRLQVINFANNGIGTGGGLYLAQALQSLDHSLPYLDLSKCNMGPKAIVDLFLAFQRNFGMSLTIRTLNLSKNKMEDLGSEMFANWLAVCRERSPLQRIILCKAHINFITISAPLRHLKNLQELDISYNKLDHAACQLLRTVVETTPTLHILNVSHCKLEGEHAALIIKAMVTNAACSETRIDMGYNKLNNQDAFAISAALRGNVNLRYLNLAGNKFKAKGLASILHSLAVATTLETLVLDDCCSSSSADVAEPLTHLVTNNTSLKALSLAGGFAKCLLGGFLVSMRTNETLEELSIAENKLGDEGASLLGDVLSSNVFLQTLHIDENHFTPSGFRCLRMGLSTNQTLRKMPFPWKDYQKAASNLSYEPHLVAFQEMVLEMQVLLSSMSAGNGAPAAPSRFLPENRATTPTEVVPLAEVPEDLEIIEKQTRLHSEGEQPLDGGYVQGGLSPMPIRENRVEAAMFTHSQNSSSDPTSSNRRRSTVGAWDENAPPLPPRD